MTPPCYLQEGCSRKKTVRDLDGGGAVRNIWSGTTLPGDLLAFVLATSFLCAYKAWWGGINGSQNGGGKCYHHLKINIL